MICTALLAGVGRLQPISPGSAEVSLGGKLSPETWRNKQPRSGCCAQASGDGWECVRAQAVFHFMAGPVFLSFTGSWLGGSSCYRLAAEWTPEGLDPRMDPEPTARRLQMCVCTSTHVCKGAHTHTCLCLTIGTQGCTSTGAHLHARTQVHVDVHPCGRAPMHVCTSAHARLHPLFTLLFAAGSGWL